MTYENVQNFSDIRHLGMRVWEIDLIVELDDIALGLWNKGKPGDKEPDLIPVTDTEGMAAMFQRIAAARKGAS